jgi:iron complex transport system substrate-binding protein
MHVGQNNRISTAVLASALLTMSLSAAHANDAATSAVSQGTGHCAHYALPAFPDLTPIAGADGTHSVTSPFGEVELPTNPAASLGMYTTDIDILIWLGFPLAKQQPIRGDNNYQSFPCFFPLAALENVTPFGNYPEYSFEQVLVAEPDFILNGLGYDMTVNERLPQIAPTYSVNAYDGRSWQEHFKETATALGRLDRYEAWLALYQARLDEVRQTIENPADIVVSPLAAWDGKFVASCYAGVECTVFRDLGLTIFKPALVDGGTGTEFGPEDLGQLTQIDFAFSSAAAGEEGLASFRESVADYEKNPLWSTLKISEHGQYVPFDMEMVYGSPSGQLAFLEVVAATLAK